MFRGPCLSCAEGSRAGCRTSGEENLSQALFLDYNFHFAGRPGPMLYNSFSEENSPNIQSKPHLIQLEAFASYPVSCCLGEETNTHLTITSSQVFVASNMVPPQPPLLQTKQPQFPQPLLIRIVLHSIHLSHLSSLGVLQQLNVLLVLQGPKMNTGFEVWPHLLQGHTIPDTNQDAVGLLGHLGTMLAHFQMALHQHCQVHFHQAALQLLQACGTAWGCCEPSAGPGTRPCWTSYDWPWTINPSCPDPSAEPSCPWADRHSHLAWCHLQAYWVSTQFARPDHW